MENHAASVARTLHWERQERDGTLWLIINEPVLDYSHAARWETSLLEAIGEHAAVIIDLTAIRYADEFGFEALISLTRRAPGTVRFNGVSPPVRSLFVLAHLEFLLLCKK